MTAYTPIKSRCWHCRRRPHEYEIISPIDYRTICRGVDSIGPVPPWALNQWITPWGMEQI